MKTRSNFLAAGISLATILPALCQQPTISTDPQSRTNVAGTDATFTVAAMGTQPLAYQWRFNSADLAGITNDTLIVTNVQPVNTGGYTVVVTNVDGAVTSGVATLTVIVLPSITRQPTNQSKSLGATAAFSALAAGTPSLHFQWRLGETNLLGKTSTSLVLTNVQLTNMGEYTVVAMNSAGSATSQVAHLEIDSTFTKITSGPIVNDAAYGWGCAWVDYDADGFIDLFVCNFPDAFGVQHDFLYHNRRDGTFERITTVPMVNESAWATAVAIGDYDNDGRPDFLITRPGNNGSGRNTLYHNDGDGHFTKISTGLIVTQSMTSHAGIWADFNRDGFLDAFVANFRFSGSSGPALDNYLYRNTGDATFDRISFGSKSLTNGDSFDAAVADINNDGWPDLVIAQGATFNPKENSLLYSNKQDGTFLLLTNSVIFTNVANSGAVVWGDYDNDGFLDLFISNNPEQTNLLYHNNGDGTFTLVTNSIVGLDKGSAAGCTWADYDNDGWLDLFVARIGQYDSNFNVVTQENNCLYHNNGNGTFTKITSGSLVNEPGNSFGCAWGDYDNDGFLDLFVSNGFVGGSPNNFLFRNNGNTNNWINFALVGTASNRSAIGAKVRVRATIAGRTIWQMREISGGSGHGCQNDPRANFGLGDATNVDLVRIEWPSGIVQTLTNVPAKRFLTVEEHQSPGVSRPRFTEVSSATNGAVNLVVTGDAGWVYVFEASTNLFNWTKVGVRSNAAGAVAFTDRKATNYSKQFYRVSVP